MRVALSVCMLLAITLAAAEAQERHPMMDSTWWITAGSYLADRDFRASASGGGGSREFDFEGALGLDDSPDLFMGELGWQYSDRWGLALQYFRSSRSASNTLERTFEWQDITFDAGARLDAKTGFQITRFLFARRFGTEDGPHRLRVGAGLHWMSLDAEVSGEARLNDNTTGFRRAAASTEFPFPNFGVWYRYSPNRNWLFTTRVDWLSASVDKYSGDIWNASAGVNYRAFKNVGFGASYQYFRLSGGIKDTNWRGDVTTTYSGPYLHISAFW